MTLQEQIRSNRFRSGIVVFGFALLLLVIAGLIGVVLDLSLGVFALAIALAYGIFALVRSRSMIAGMTRAQALGEKELEPLRRLVENVSIGAGLAVTPEIRLVDDAAPNAFAAGLRPEKSYVGVTTGLLRTMPKRELEAVIAHEISHIRNRDTYLMTMATVFAGVIALVADIGFRSIAYGGRSRKAGGIVVVLAVVGFILAPYAALLLRMSLSRRREYLADAGAAEILNDPEAMALALRRLELDTTSLRYADASTAHLWVESPTDRVDSERRGVLAMSGLFNTHPALPDRIEALEEVGGFRLPERLPDDEPFAAALGLT
ncbi:MAG: M48 family metalloprotease [Thermoleophilia bacterium]|nr:M48 family metalloprotease [Thermoleophilia bacterium]MDH4340697.1 M48 family metalloprotease [Thermoleophilia bacterium]